MFQYTPYTVPLLLVVVLGVAGAYLTWRQRDTRAETWFAAVELSMALWAAMYLVLVSLTGYEAKLAVLTYGTPVVVFLPITVFVFSVHYTGHGHWLTRRRTAGLLALPFVQMAAASTNDRLQLHYVDPQLVEMGSHVEIQYGWGPMTVAANIVAWTMVVVAIWLMVQKFRNSRNVYRKLSFLLVVTFAVMLLANVVSILGYSPLPHMLLLPYTFLVFGSIAILTTTSVRFVRALPVDSVLSRLSSRFDNVVLMARDFIVEEIDNGVIVLDNDGTVVDINGTAKTMLGTERAVSRPIHEVVDLDRVVSDSELVAALQEDRLVEEVRDQVWVETSRGERCYDVDISALTDGGETVGRVVLMHDVTDQKRREEALREREQQLQVQNERLDRFAGIVSHDLRNPLNVSKGRAELMAARLRDGGTVDVEHVEKIMTAQERMEAIIDDALTLARQGRAITETEPVDLDAVATEAWDNVDTQEATLDIGTERVVDGDPDRLLNVFENLFRNAMEHTDTTVTVTVDDAGDGFFVADDGPGIPAEERDSVLEQGYTTSDDGTGFGLAIVADIARAHGWSVDVTESADGGARFEFRDVAGVTPDIAESGERTAVDGGH